MKKPQKLLETASINHHISSIKLPTSQDKTMKMIALNGPHHKRYVVYNKKGKIIIITRNKNTARLFLKKADTKIAA